MNRYLLNSKTPLLAREGNFEQKYYFALQQLPWFLPVLYGINTGPGAGRLDTCLLCLAMCLEHIAPQRA